MIKKGLFVFNNGTCVDYLPIIFMIVAFVGLALAVCALYFGRKVNNSHRTTVIALSVAAAVLFVGAFVLGLIGKKPFYDYYYDYYDHHYYYFNAWRKSTAWVCLGLGIAAFLSGAGALLTHIFTKNIVDEADEDKVVKGVDFEKESNECIFYQEFSQGAIEVKDGYIVYYKNLLPFTKCKNGRVASIVFINDIQHVVYKGCGWFGGILGFTFKHFNKPLTIHFGKFFVWRSKKLNKKMTPIYEYIKMQVINNNK